MHTILCFAFTSGQAADLRRTVSSPFQNSGLVHNDPSSRFEGNGILSDERLINFGGVVQLQLQAIVCKENKEIACKLKKKKKKRLQDLKEAEKILQIFPEVLSIYFTRGKE